MQQRTFQLEGPLRADVEAKRQWVLGHYERDPVESYASVEAKLVLLETILSNGWVAPSETVKLQSLGVTFGDALAQELGLKWVAVEDDFGTDPALIMEGTSVKAFPLTSISKRVEAGETVDVRALFHRACATIRRIVADA